MNEESATENVNEAKPNVPEPQLQISKQEATLLQLAYNYNQAVIADVHTFIAGMQEAGEDTEKKLMFTQGLVSSRVNDLAFGGMLITTAGKMMNDEEKEALKKLVETLYSRVVRKIAYDIATSAKDLDLKDPTQEAHL